MDGCTNTLTDKLMDIQITNIATDVWMNVSMDSGHTNPLYTSPKENLCLYLNIKVFPI